MQRIKLLLNSVILTLLMIPLVSLALPPGDYKKSCAGCNMSGGTLNCQCTDYNGASRNTSIRQAHHCGFIQNMNGQLVCTANWRHRLPPGSYLHTCQQCRYDGKHLSCRCLKRNNIFRWTELNVQHCGYQITNQDGQLICGGK